MNKKMQLAAVLISAAMAGTALASQPKQADPDYVNGRLKTQWDYFEQRGHHGNRLMSNVDNYYAYPAAQALRQGRIKLAEQKTLFALERVPNHPIALSVLSELGAKQPEKTALYDSYFTNAIRINQTPAQPYAAYAVHLHRTKRVKQSISYYLQALHRDDQNMETHYNLGLAYFKLKNYPKANEYGQTAYKLGYPLPGLKNKLKRVGAWAQ